MRKSVCTLGCMTLLLAVGAGQAIQPCQAANPAPAGPSNPRYSVAVLPFLSLARTTDAIAKTAIPGKPAMGIGPSGLLANALTGTGKVVGLTSSRADHSRAPLLVHGVITTFKHEKVLAPRPHWEARVDLALRLLDATSHQELFRGTYSGTAPAAGAISEAQVGDMFRRGLSLYATQPLGLAFQQAVKRAAGTIPAAADQSPSLVSQIEPLMWEGTVIAWNGASLTINAGTKNGLRVGQRLAGFVSQLVPMGEGQDLQRRSLDPAPGLLQVSQVDALTATVTSVSGYAEATPTTLPIGSTVVLKQDEAKLANRSIAEVVGTATHRRPFLKLLQDWLDVVEARNAIPRDRLIVRGDVSEQDGTFHANLALIDEKAPSQPLAQHESEGPSGSWNRMATEFFRVFIRQVGGNWPVGDLVNGPVVAGAPQPRPAGAVVSTPLTQATLKQAEKLPQTPAVDSKALRITIALTDDTGTQILNANQARFHQNDLIHLRVDVSQDCFVQVYHVDPAGRLTRIWPQSEKDPGKIRAGTPLRLPDNGLRLRIQTDTPALEQFMAIGWTDPAGSEQLAARQLKTFDDLRPALQAAAQFASRGIIEESAEPGNAGVRDQKLIEEARALRANQKSLFKVDTAPFHIEANPGRR